MKNLIHLSKEKLIEKLWAADPNIKKILSSSDSIENARRCVFDYLISLERKYYDLSQNQASKKMHVIEINNSKRCIRVLKTIINPENESLTKFSALETLWKISRKKCDLNSISKGFLCEFIYLIFGINGHAFRYLDVPEYVGKKENRQAALVRSRKLDHYSSEMTESMSRYANGLDPSIIKKREVLKKDILRHFGATEKDWENYHWHLEHVICDASTVSKLVKLDKDELEGLRLAEKNKIPFQITPHYLALFNKNGKIDADRAIRAQVLPSTNYSKNVVESRKKKLDMDFMGEKSTSPIDCITRRYPQIVILKPFESCPQICVYCQRNWEIKSIHEAKITKNKIIEALEWLRTHKTVKEVLVTGGDPLTLPNDYLEWLFSELSKLTHVERIRIGTRVLVTVPQRIDRGFLNILKKYHQLGKREICIVTHFEHSSEMCPEALKAIKDIRELGISIYNQQVFTYYNSRKYETCLLRKTLKLCGIDPYYSFNTKGKAETIDFRVPIPRIEQERKEEARLLPGIVRSDEPVFNVPKLGKSHLRSWQNHSVIMVLADGRRVYRFYPWESKILLTDTYNYTDVSIYEYLMRLYNDGEDLEDYRSIWYYF
ncbi:KamA family radical SAM protein [Candidatus Micrarchaeota archaeon]|nr:KamA family radical SAM protein [Candidatus Micrarchaeota archaeon]MBU1886587.1 KamA family radical SAM protein [Candidatus Micrarchaeota archaeon]